MTTRTSIMSGVSALALGVMLGMAAPVQAQETTDNSDPCADEGLGFLYEGESNPDCAGSDDGDDFLSGLGAETDSEDSAEADADASADAESDAMADADAEDAVEETASSDDPVEDESGLLADGTDGSADDAGDGADVMASEDAEAGAEGGLEGEQAEASTGEEFDDEALTASSDGSSEADDLEALFGDTGFDDGSTGEGTDTAAGDDGLGGDDGTGGDMGAGDDLASSDSGLGGDTGGDDGDLTDPNLASNAVSGDATDPGVDDSLEIAADDDGSGDSAGDITNAANNGALLIFADSGDALIGLGVSPDLSQLITIGDPSNLDSLVDVGVLAPAGDPAALINATVGDGLDDGITSLIGLDLGGDSNLGENSNLVQATLGSTFTPIADALAGQTQLLAPIAAILDIGVQNQ